jgi:serpin B
MKIKIYKRFINLSLGSEAAAATAVIVEIDDMLPPDSPPHFVLDHSFLYFIKDEKTGLILFAGRVANPIKN